MDHHPKPFMDPLQNPYTTLTPVSVAALRKESFRIVFQNLLANTAVKRTPYVLVEPMCGELGAAGKWTPAPASAKICTTVKLLRALSTDT